MSDHPEPSDGASPTTPQPLHPPAEPTAVTSARPVEVGGRSKGLEPTRYGDWEKDGRCIDF